MNTEAINIANNFRKELAALLEKYNVSIDVDISEGHGGAEYVQLEFDIDNGADYEKSSYSNQLTPIDCYRDIDASDILKTLK